MIPLPAAVAAAALGVERLADDVTGVSIDTRTLRPGDLFVALQGERLDGHEFVPAAFAAGACGAVAHVGAAIAGDSAWEVPGSPGRVYRVPDTLVALGSLARAERRLSGVTVIAVTGSVGKTGTKDLIRAMASRLRRVAATAANENNEIGVPLTLLGIDRETQLIVVEMGMRGIGQIAELAAIAEPDVGVVTKVAPVHLELVGSLRDVAAAKAELFAGLGAGGVAVSPAGESLLEPHLQAVGRRVVRFSYGDRSDGADVWGSSAVSGEGKSRLTLHWSEGEIEVEVPFVALHRLQNAIAAAAACYAAGLPLGECAPGLADVDFTPLRGDEHDVAGVLLLDHSYNANPAATLTALEDLCGRAARRGGLAVAVLGDMLELGEGAEAYHRQVGELAAVAGVGLLVGVGDLSRHTVDAFRLEVEQGVQRGTGARAEGWWLEDVGGLEGSLIDLKSRLSAGDVVLVKGSRAIGLERAVAVLRLGAGSVEPPSALQPSRGPGGPAGKPRDDRAERP